MNSPKKPLTREEQEAELKQLYEQQDSIQHRIRQAELKQLYEQQDSIQHRIHHLKDQGSTLRRSYTRKNYCDERVKTIKKRIEDLKKLDPTFYLSRKWTAADKIKHEEAKLTKFETLAQQLVCNPMKKRKTPADPTEPIPEKRLLSDIYYT